MKKIIGFALSLMILFLIVPFGSSSAYSGGALDGKVLQIGTSFTTNTSSTDLITDGDEGTSITVAPGQYVWYAFNSGELAKITHYQLKASGTTLDIKYVRLDGTSAVYHSTPISTGVKTSHNSTYNDIVKVGFQNTGSTAINVFEFDLFVIFQETVPAAPSSLIAIGMNDAIQLSWNPVSNATNYSIKRSIIAGGPYEVIATNITGTSYLDSNVVHGETYYYVVSAQNTVGNSGDSNEASAKLITLGRGILTITMSNGLEKEYDLSIPEINAFIDWYDAKDVGSGPAKYKFIKTWNKGPFKTRTEYVIFDKILTFDVDEYDVVTP
ncbi:fibronectin type III domain-containing protein [Cohnella luojiensis]|uniref:Fibronectin type III domain-containing protein n=1 Tax=Cohnella luojiensis TaxID=652876 RepID=A0A4Y8M7X4_9BACL|nr:fibronectin type III domain-containing protein [Cohnella luojiensis]TFE30849.1 fibronectin type III domain-containing protein [Cohnella luojiensis]